MGFGKYVAVLSVSLLGAVLCGGLLGANAVAPKAISARSLSTLIEQGEQALFAKDFKAARDDFRDVLIADPRNLMALEGATLAYLELEDFAHAKAELEKAVTLSPRPSRWSAINGASIYVHTKGSMRGTRLLIDYMTPMTDVDEEALNALAVCINSADDQARKARLYPEAVNFYAAQNKKLEQKNPGMKRWGTQWLPSEEAAKKMTAWSKTVASATQLGKDLAALKAHLALVQRSQGDPNFEYRVQVQNYQRGYGRGGFGRMGAGLGQLQGQGQGEIDPINELTLSRLEPEVEAKQAEYDNTMKLAERPPVPDFIDPVNLNSPAPTAVARARLASNANPGLEPTNSQPPTQPANTPRPAPETQPAQVATAKPPTDAQSGSPAAPSPSTLHVEPTPPAPATSGTEPKKTYRVTSYAAAFPVGPNLLITAAEAVAGAGEIQVQAADGAAYPATVVRSDAECGLALVQVPTAKFNWLRLADQFSGGTISCVSFPAVDLFQPSAALIAGSALAPKQPWHVRLSESPRLGGGALLASGQVVGVELATRDSEIGSIPAVTLDDLKKFLASDLSPGGAAADGVAATMQVTATREK